MPVTPNNPSEFFDPEFAKRVQERHQSLRAQRESERNARLAAEQQRDQEHQRNSSRDEQSMAAGRYVASVALRQGLPVDLRIHRLVAASWWYKGWVGFDTMPGEAVRAWDLKPATKGFSSSYRAEYQIDSNPGIALSTDGELCSYGYRGNKFVINDTLVGRAYNQLLEDFAVEKLAPSAFDQ